MKILAIIAQILSLRFKVFFRTLPSVLADVIGIIFYLFNNKFIAVSLYIQNIALQLYLNISVLYLNLKRKNRLEDLNMPRQH